MTNSSDPTRQNSPALDLTFPENQLQRNVWDKLVEVEESSYYWRSEPVLLPGEPYAGNSPTIVELFAGCGGTSLGFEMAGYHVCLGADILRPAAETFRANHPKAATVLGDLKSVKSNHLIDIIPTRNVDVLVAGVPCQGFSLNNRKRNTDDKRNLLYKEFIRFAKEIKPKFIVLENVSGMASSGGFRETIESDLSRELGLKVKSTLLNALDFGVPQRRQRLIFIGSQRPFDFSTITPTHGPNREEPYNTVRDAIDDLPSLESGEEAFFYDSQPQSAFQRLMRSALSAGQPLTCHRAPNHPPETIDRIRRTPQGQPMYPAFKQRIRLSWDQPSPTQVSGGIRPQFQFGHPRDARGLTIRERCRIQSFPDTFVVHGGIVQGRVQTGNAVPPLLAKAIAEALRTEL